MQTFQTTFRNIVSSVSSFARTIDGKYPTDEDLQKHREVLNNLKDEITEIRQQFTLHGDNLMCASESAVVLSKSVAQFYQQAENSEITKSIQSYNSINEEIANRTVRLFQQQLHTSEGLISELDNWLQMVQLLQQKIEDAERIQSTVQTTSDRLNSLKEQCDRLKKKQANSVSGSTATIAQEIRELEERIQDTTNTKNASTKEFQDQKQLINEIVTQMLKDKYRIFDRVYIQLLECQLAIIGAHFNLTKPFRTSVDEFRKKYKNYEESATSHPLNILTEKLLLHNKMDRKSTSNRNQSDRNKQREEDEEDDEENDRKVNKTSNNYQDNNTTEKNRVNNQNGDNNNNTETNGTGNHGARNGKSTNNTNNSAESKNKAPPVPVQPPPPLPGKNKAPVSTSASQQEHNDFLFGDFTSPTSSVNGTELEDQEFGDFIGHNATTASTTVTNENNKPKMERKDSGDFWGMFGSANDSKTSSNKPTAEKSKPSSGNPSNFNSKPESEASRKLTGGDRGNNQPSIPQTQPSKITDPDKIRQKVQERIRFVNESYEKEARERAERNKYKDELELKLDEWEFNNGVRRNIRSLLTKLPEILWEDSGWKPVSLGDLVQPVKCKKAYQIAVRVVHPDRAANRGDDMKKTVICERVFTALNEAWKEFENTS